MATRFSTPDAFLEQGDVDAGSYAPGDAPIYDGTRFEGGPAKGFIFHGADANAPRPDNFISVEWIGSVEPLNAIEGDTFKQAGP